MCKSHDEPGGPRRCSGDARARAERSARDVLELEGRGDDLATAAGVAHFVGSGTGVVHDGDRVVDWNGEARLYHLHPPLGGYSVVVASTLPNAGHVKAGGRVERGVETFLYGVTGEDLQIEPDWNELPGSAWGSTVDQALAEAGYELL